MDSFSMLPDDVLVHILSFIDTKSSVSTSILAKRWRFLWARVPNLGFVSKRYCPETRASLSSIINRVLLLHRGYNIGIFSLVVNEKDGISNSELEMFVAALIACNVREIYLSCDAKFPRCLFTCKTLVELFLTNSGDIPEATTVTVYLPALKVLFLCDVCCESNESLQHLLSGCPVLEELTIFSSSLFPYSISSPTTKMLSLVTVYGDVAADDDDEDEGMDHEYVDVDDDDGDDDDEEEEEEEEEEDEGMDHQKYFSIGTLTSLAEAYISILCPGKPIRGGISYFHYVVKLVGKICEAKTLKLTLEAGLMIGVRDSAFSALTMKFHNLTKLHLVADWRFVTKFLESADNLQDLTISTGDCVCPENWVEPDEVAACLVSRVGIVIFDKFGCTKESEFKMVRYILRNAKVLKWMAIRLKCDSNDMKFEAAQKIRSFERGSEACEIFFQI